MWIVAGGVMVTIGWLAGLSQNFTDKTDVWRDICVVRPLSSLSFLSSVFQVETVLYVVTAVVPVLTTDTQILDL